MRPEAIRPVEVVLLTHNDARLPGALLEIEVEEPFEVVMVRSDLDLRAAFRGPSQGNAAHRQVDDKTPARLELERLLRVVIGERRARQSQDCNRGERSHHCQCASLPHGDPPGLGGHSSIARRDRSVPLRARLDEGGEMKVSEDHCGSPYTQTPPMRTRTRMSWLPLEFQKVSLCCRPALS